MEGQLSPADIAVLSGNTGNGGNSGFGEGSGWWIIIVLLLFGWGRNGFGNQGGGSYGGSGIGENYVLATDFATIERKLDGVNNGLCDGFYAMAQQFSNTNQNIANSTASLQNTLCQGFNGVNTAILQNAIGTERGLWNLSSQFADCCCKTQRAIDGVNFNISQLGCGITNAINTATRDVIDNQNANYRAIHEELVANKLEMKNDRIAEQQNEINALRLAASQERQNAYLLSELKPCPSAAYIVPNPNCCYNYQVTPTNNCGCGNY